jgi:hypothetical protein
MNMSGLDVTGWTFQGAILVNCNLSSLPVYLRFVTVYKPNLKFDAIMLEGNFFIICTLQLMMRSDEIA